MAAACNLSVSIHMYVCVCLSACVLKSSQVLCRVNQKTSKNPVCSKTSVAADKHPVCNVYIVHTLPFVELILAKPLPDT